MLRVLGVLYVCHPVWNCPIYERKIRDLPVLEWTVPYRMTNVEHTQHPWYDDYGRNTFLTRYVLSYL